MPIASWLRRSSEMASGKRASMREGPLAALFRKTEEEGLHGEGVPPQQAPPEQPQRQREEFRTPAGGVHESPVQPRQTTEPELRPAPPSARTPVPSRRATATPGA